MANNSQHRESRQQSQSDKALDDIIKDNAPGLRSYVRSMVSNSDDADDIVQDTFYQFLRTISIMDNPIGHVTSWLYTVARNLVINHGKKRRELTMTKTQQLFQGTSSAYTSDDSFMADLSEIMMASDADNPEMCMLRKMVWDELNKALSELSTEQRQAVEMTEIQGLSIKDAAEATHVPIGTFLSRKHHAVLHIRKHLKQLYEELTGETSGKGRHS